LVSPELVEAMDACEVPQEYPGSNSERPNDWDLFMKGHLEVPKCGSAEDSCPSCPPQVEQESIPMEPKEGMILGPKDRAPAPMPAEPAASRLAPAAPNVSEARLQTAPLPAPMPAPEPKKPYSRYTSSKPNAKETSQAGSKKGPPGFIGPVGYDVVK
jgi:hypothetical protein